MKTLLTLMVVLLLAAPAWSACTTSDQQATAASDAGGIGNLPAASPSFTPTDCSTADWRFDFDRTANSNSTVILIEIDCMSSVSQTINSKDYTKSESHTIGPYNDWSLTNTDAGHLHISKVSGLGDDYLNMDLRQYDFK